MSPILASQASRSHNESPTDIRLGATEPSGVSNAGYTPPSNLSYCGLLGPDPGTAPGLPSTDAGNASILWNDLCVQTVFATLVNTWGGPFVLAYPDSGANLSYWTASNLTAGSGGDHGFLFATFDVRWEGACTNDSASASSSNCDIQEYWRGNVSANAPSGPFSVGGGCPSCSAPGGGSGPTSPSPAYPSGFILTFSLAGAVTLGIANAARRAHR